MGNTTTTESRSTQIVDTLMRVVNNSTANCRTGLTQEQLINLAATGTGSQIVIPTITGNQAARINTTCYQSTINNSQLENAIRQAAQQEAQSITQTLSLPSQTEVRIVNNAINNLTEEIINSTRQECSNLARQSQIINITTPGQDAQVYVGSVDWNQTFQGVLSCVQNSSNVSRAKAELDQVLGQYARQEQQNTFGSLFLIIAIVVVVIIIIIAIVVVIAGPSIAGAATKALVPIP